MLKGQDYNCDKQNKYVVICDTDIPGRDGDHKTFEMMTSTLQGPS
jgi:hypothetical protein